ncbi:MAG: hypothetical protein KGZ94_02635, partial [Clostridia bacterium]|nr:hypothetical protein [Clostridia bacterium]
REFLGTSGVGLMGRNNSKMPLMELALPDHPDITLQLKRGSRANNSCMVAWFFNEELSKFSTAFL